MGKIFLKFQMLTSESFHYSFTVLELKPWIQF